MLVDLFEFAQFNGGVYFFCFRLGIPLLGKFRQETQNYQSELKSGTHTNSNLQNSTVNLLLLFTTEISFLTNLVQKIKIVSLS